MVQNSVESTSGLIETNKSGILVGFASVFVLLSATSLFREHMATSIFFAIGAIAILIMTFPGALEYLKLGSALEMKMQRVEEALTEAKEITKLVAEIAIPLAHQTDGWTDGSPATVQTKNLVLPRITEMVNKLDVGLDDEIVELDYFKTCGEYVHLIIHLREANNERMAIINRLHNRNIPASIEDVETPDSLRVIIAELGFLNDRISEYLTDYKYYFANREHRNMNRWLERGRLGSN